MRAKEREQNVGAGYSNEHEGIALLEGAVVCHALIAPASRGCDRGWRAATMLRSRSTQEMDVGSLNKVDEMKVARPPVKGNVARLTHYSTLRTHPRTPTVVVHNPAQFARPPV